MRSSWARRRSSRPSAIRSGTGCSACSSSGRPPSPSSPRPSAASRAGQPPRQGAGGGRAGPGRPHRQGPGAVERYYGRTAWRLELGDDPTANTLLLCLVSGEIVASAPGQPHLLQLRRLPLSAGQALALADRLQAVADEFERAEPAGPPDGQLWGVLLGVYPTDVPILSTGPEAR
jgi:hypothetical protein